jgi:hypothetical protein
VPSIEGLLTDLKNDLVATLAPYQPNLPPSYPNTSPLAGAIPPTLITKGEPIQYPVLERLENHYAQVTVFAMGGRVRPMPYLNNTATFKSLLLGSPPQGYWYVPVARCTKQLYIQVWSYDAPTRDEIGAIIHAHLGDYYRITNAADGTVELYTFQNLDDEDAEQLDSVYIREFTYNCDFIMCQKYNVAEIERIVQTLQAPDGTVYTSQLPEGVLILAGDQAADVVDDPSTHVIRPVAAEDTAAQSSDAQAVLRGIGENTIDLTDTASAPGDTPST